METAVPTAFSGSLSSPGSSSPNQDSTSIHCVLHAHILPDAGHTMKSTGEKVLDLQRGSHVLQTQAQHKSHRGWTGARMECDADNSCICVCDHCSDKPPWHAMQWRKDLGAVPGCGPSHWGKSRQPLKRPVMLYSQPGDREWWMPLLSLPCPLYGMGFQSREWCCPEWTRFPNLINLIRRAPEACKRPVLWVIPGHVHLMNEVSHHNWC